MHVRRYHQPGVACRSAALLTELLRALSKYSHFISMVIMQAMMASSTETNALLAFKSSSTCGYSGCLCTTNPFDTWTGTACSGSNSTWDGVTCTSGSVGTISLSGRCLKSGLPMDWAMLTALIDLDLYNNAMTGRLPVEWSSLTNLDYMRLGINSLSLTLPPEWGSLTALTFLSLHENNLNGSLPDLWSNLVNLKVLRLYKNPLTGTIPPSYTSLVNILTSPSPAFTLLHTFVYGSIPAGLAGKVFGNNGDFKLWPNPPVLSTSRPPAPTSSPPPLPSPSLHPLTPQPPTPSANPGQSVTLSPPSPPLNPRPTPSPISQPTSATLKIAVGAGLGGGVVLIAGAFLIFFYLKRQKPASTVQEPKFENINDLSDLPPLSQPYSSEFSAITPTIASGEDIKASRATSQLQSSTGDSSGVVNSSVINLSSFVLPQVRQDIREDLAQIYRNAEIDPDDLEVGESVGRGASGEVTRGVWRGTEVAVKIFYESLVPSSDRMDGFKGEVAMMSRLSHPNIVQLYGYVIQPGRLAIVSEFVHCGSLFDLLHGSDPLDLKRREAIDGQQWLAIALDILRGMDYLHSRNPAIVHRDLKSPNLLVSRTCQVKVCDFGMSRALSGDFISTTSGIGTPQWSAPEVMRGEKVSEKSDVYSFGVVLWEIVMVERPWRSLRPEQVVFAVGGGRRGLNLPSSLQPEVSNLIRECWHPQPSERPSFAAIFKRLSKLKELKTSK